MSDPTLPEPPAETPWFDPRLQQPSHDARLYPPAFDVGPAKAPDFRARAIWPCLGPALWMGGVLLWSYVAFGRLVLNQHFPEAAAMMIVAFCFALSAYASLEQSLAAEPAPTPSARRARIAQATLLGVGLFLATVSVAILVGMTSHEDLDTPLSLFLTVSALVAVFVGRRGTHAHWLAKEPARRALGIFLWLASIALTLLAWAS